MNQKPQISIRSPSRTIRREHVHHRPKPIFPQETQSRPIGSTPLRGRSVNLPCHGVARLTIFVQAADVYRAKLQNGLEGSEGNEVARARIEAYANKIRPRSFLVCCPDFFLSLSSLNKHPGSHYCPCGGPRKLGATAIQRPARGRYRGNECFNCQYPAPRPAQTLNAPQSVKFHMSYADSISVSLSTAYLFNYPMSSFARLPVSLTVSLDLFESSASPRSSDRDTSTHGTLRLLLHLRLPFHPSLF